MKSFSEIKNKVLLLISFPLLSGIAAYPQQANLPGEKATIIMKDGQQVENAGLWEVRSNVLEYELNGNLHDALIADIEKIRMPEADYIFSANNSLEKVNADSLSITDSSHAPGIKNNYEQGYSDAEKYYNGAGAAVGSYVSGMTPILGWFVIMPIIGATRPQMYNSENPNVGKLQDKDYNAGYKKKATEKKLTSAFAGFGLGLATLFLLVL